MQAIICRRNGKTDIEAEIKIFFSVSAFFDLFNPTYTKCSALGKLVSRQETLFLFSRTIHLNGLQHILINAAIFTCTHKKKGNGKVQWY